MIKTKVKVTERTNPGKMRKMVEDLGGLGQIVLGVQGAQAAEAHPDSSLTVGELAAAHELGLGVPKRSWLVAWMDGNQDRMMRQARGAMSAIMSGRTTRERAFAKLGAGWVKELQENITSGKVTPALSPLTIARKGHGIPLFKTGKLVQSISFTMRLPKLSDKKARAAAAFALRG